MKSKLKVELIPGEFYHYYWNDIGFEYDYILQYVESRYQKNDTRLYHWFTVVSARKTFCAGKVGAPYWIVETNGNLENLTKLS